MEKIRAHGSACLADTGLLINENSPSCIVDEQIARGETAQDLEPKIRTDAVSENEEDYLDTLARKIVEGHWRYRMIELPVARGETAQDRKQNKCVRITERWGRDIK